MSKFELKVVKPKKPRSNFNLSFVNRFSANPMLAIPVACLETLPDDTFIVEIQNRITTDSLLSPALANFKVSFHQFFVPLRLYSKALSTNTVAVVAGSLLERDLPLPSLSWPSLSASDAESVERASVKECSLADMLGIPVGFVNKTSSSLKYNVLPWLAYYDIVRNYFVHKQANYVPIMQPVINADGVNYDAVPVAVDISRLDLMAQQAQVDQWALALSGNLEPSVSSSVPFGGLACTTFMPDQFTNYLSNTQVAKISDLVKIGVQTDAATEQHYLNVDDMIYGNKLYRYLTISILGGNSTLSDWLHAHWGVDVNFGINKPQYLGSTTSWVKFGEVVSTSNTLAQDGDSVTGLGDRGGVGFGAGRSKKRRFNFSENGVYMVIMTIVPEIDYAQGIRKDLLKTRFSDLYVPSLDGIGFQDIAMSELNALPLFDVDPDTGELVYNYLASSTADPGRANPFALSIGKQPAWMEYMTKQNELHGRLVPSGDLGYWALSRTFFGNSPDRTDVPADRDPALQSAPSSLYYRWTPYGYPWEFNYLFNNTDRLAQNFICEVKFDIVAKRQKSKNMQPTLV